MNPMFHAGVGGEKRLTYFLSNSCFFQFAKNIIGLLPSFVIPTLLFPLVVVFFTWTLWIQRGMPHWYFKIFALISLVNGHAERESLPNSMIPRFRASRLLFPFS